MTMEKFHQGYRIYQAGTTGFGDSEITTAMNAVLRYEIFPFLQVVTYHNLNFLHLSLTQATVATQPLICRNILHDSGITTPSRFEVRLNKETGKLVARCDYILYPKARARDNTIGFINQALIVARKLEFEAPQSR
jgi:hypothetical protein